ncbi:MAG: phosphate acyltransferase PlsX [Alphaproteobacteria bacterium]|jgi:glycerol-3-phosphate acyltransferase PlsX|nr:phosphate acyltransferase PlsX [Alphaproteobacteria bacterium]
MGGDHGTAVIVKGIAMAMTTSPNMRPILVGDETLIQKELSKYSDLQAVEIVHTTDIVPAEEKPSVALRNGKNTSMRLAINLVQEGKADAAVSCGNTGALMAMALIALRTIDGIDRPALAANLPTIDSKCCMLDLGANIDCTAEHLVQFALMGETFSRVVNGNDNPSIGLLNVGAEEQKGNAVLREAAAMLSASKSEINYYGFVEGNDITMGAVDVVVSDGFSGNIALKTAEGTAKFITTLLRRSLKSSLMAKIGYLFVRSALKPLRHKLNPQRYNGAVLLGLNGIVVKSHGSATDEGVAYAINTALQMINHNYMDDLRQSAARATIAIDRAENGNA